MKVNGCQFFDLWHTKIDVSWVIFYNTWHSTNMYKPPSFTPAAEWAWQLHVHHLRTSAVVAEGTLWGLKLFHPSLSVWRSYGYSGVWPGTNRNACKYSGKQMVILVVKRANEMEWCRVVVHDSMWNHLYPGDKTFQRVYYHIQLGEAVRPRVLAQELSDVGTDLLCNQSKCSKAQCRHIYVYGVGEGFA